MVLGVLARCLARPPGFVEGLWLWGLLFLSFDLQWRLCHGSRSIILLARGIQPIGFGAKGMKPTVAICQMPERKTTFDSSNLLISLHKLLKDINLFECLLNMPDVRLSAEGARWQIRVGAKWQPTVSTLCRFSLSREVLGVAFCRSGKVGKRTWCLIQDPRSEAGDNPPKYFGKPIDRWNFSYRLFLPNTRSRRRRARKSGAQDVPGAPRCCPG